MCAPIKCSYYTVSESHPFASNGLSCYALWSDPFEMIYSSLSFSISLIPCSSLEMGPRVRNIVVSFRICLSPELIELRRALFYPWHCCFVVGRRESVILKVIAALSKSQASSGRSVERHAARMPTLVSTHESHRITWWLSEKGFLTQSRSHMCHCYWGDNLLV
jgi:hypothetical protein